jgi:uncharacterized delta-60 repeat protein
MHRLFAALALTVSLLITANAAAAPTDLDRGFGVDGRVSVGFDGKNDGVYAMAPASGGGVIAVGWSGQGGALVFRLDARGDLDRTFDSDGIVLLDAAKVASAFDVAVQPDGKIVVAGRVGYPSDGAVARLLPDGRPDSSFGNDGVRTIDSGGAESLTEVELQSDGKIVVAGDTSLGDDGVVYRLKPGDGSLDGTFDQDGAVGLDSGGDESIAGLAIQPDGKVVAAGYTSTTRSAAVYRLNPDGSPDTTFDGDGARGIQVGPSYTSAEALAVQPDGRILVAGEGDHDAMAARLDAYGALDTTFGVDGIARVDYGDGETANRIALLPDGRILGAGHTSVGEDALLFQLTADGAPDASFATAGVFAFGGGGLVNAEAMSALPDGRFVIGGESDAYPSQALVYAFVGDRRAPEPADPRPADPVPADPLADGLKPAVPTVPTRPVTCDGRRATIVGTPGRDRLRGTKRRDVIAGLGGNDVLVGLGGDDVVCGGAGADRLEGGGGRDRLLGGPGNDRLLGGPGRDRLLGGSGRNFVKQ